MPAVEKVFEHRESVFYRREGDKAEWRGPATVIGNKGGVHYIVHQSEVMRVTGCRLVEANNEQEQNNPVKQTETKTFKKQ